MVGDLWHFNYTWALILSCISISGSHPEDWQETVFATASRGDRYRVSEALLSEELLLR